MQYTLNAYTVSEFQIYLNKLNYTCINVFLIFLMKVGSNITPKSLNSEDVRPQISSTATEPSAGVHERTAITVLDPTNCTYYFSRKPPDI